MRATRQIQSGFTLVEMIIVMVITGIIGGMVAIFITAPVQQYTDSARRAELTDIADTAVQRVLRDIRTAVPNSVRQPAACTPNCVEFLPTKAGGRYRANDVGGTLCGVATVANAGDALSFVGIDTCFGVIGLAVVAVPPLAAGDYVVVGSTQSSGALPYDQTATGVLRKITGVAVTGGLQSISISGVLLPPSAQLDSQRFQIVDKTAQAVTYSCENVNIDASGNGTGTLKRYSGYGFNGPTIPSAAPVLANNISACSFVYAIGSYQHDGLVGLSLQITQSGETVSLYEEVHVNNAP